MQLRWLDELFFKIATGKILENPIVSFKIKHI